MRLLPARLPDPRRNSRDAPRRGHDRRGKSEHPVRIHPARMTTQLADSVPRLKRLLPRLRGKRMGVLGDLMLDRYLWGTASRLSPEAAVPVVDFAGQKDFLGGAANVAKDRKSTRLNSSHSQISYAVFCLKKKRPCCMPAATQI